MNLYNLLSLFIILKLLKCNLKPFYILNYDNKIFPCYLKNCKESSFQY